MKILFLNTNIGYGGATKIMLWLAGRLAERGNDVTFLTYRDPSENREVPTGVKHIHIPLETSGHSISGLVKSVRQLHRHIKEERYDWGIAFLSPSHLRLSLASMDTQTKILLSQRGDPYQSRKDAKSMMSRVEAFAFNRADKYVFQTPQAMAYYSKSIQYRGVVIPNPVKPLERTCKRTPDDRIVNVARLDINQKRQDLLIEAFNLISTEYPGVTLHFFGDGDDETKLKEMAMGNDRIVFDGVTSDVVKDIQNAKMFVLSSDFEGIPNALIEAMSLGVPCVSTKCSPGGADLLIKDGKNGILTPRGNADALAMAIKRFLDAPTFAEQCGEKALNVVNEFSEDRIFRLWEQIIVKCNV